MNEILHSMKKTTTYLGLALVLTVPLITGCAKRTKSASATDQSPRVRQVAAHPSAYLGKRTLTGVIGIINAGKGFVLVDMKEYQNEGFACLTNDEPSKLSVAWKGAAPKVKEKVRVKGTLTKGKNGYVYTAEKVEKQ